MSFSWIPFYREVAQQVLTCEDKQDGLIKTLSDMKATGLLTIPLDDYQLTGPSQPLTQIDPFTFMANFSRTGDTQAAILCAWLKEKWHLTKPAPTDFDGRANVEAQNSWFFTSIKGGRGSEDISLLWQLAHQAFNGKVSELDPELFVRCLAIKKIAIKKLTTGLSWFSPDGFLPLVGPVLPYLTERGVKYDLKKLVRGDLEEYRSLMEKADGISYNKAKVSHDAWLWALNKPALAPATETPQFPLNQILYGPPGTGKTFTSVNRAVQIIDGFASTDRDVCKARFDELRDSGQIEFVTFHQSFSYEEFIEGLRPDLDVEGGEARYKIQNGVLKELALRALGNSLKKEVASRPTFDDLWDELLRQIETDGVELDGLSGATRYRLSVTTQGNIDGKNLQSHVVLSCSRKKAAYVWRVSQGNEKVNSSFVQNAVGNSHSGLIAAVVNRLKAMSGTIAGQQSYASNFPEAAKSYLEGSSEYRANFDQAPRYVLIVDEINRGNISKILGELITLLEDDKRLGASNELRAKLPVSAEPFCLPPNLYILGTMNTADKSLALLDIALRRRFSFAEMPPRVDLFPAFAREVLQTLNLRIEAALDREHRLGHAYFIGCKTEGEFNQVFRDKIIPLLQEFFYNDWETLRSVLGEVTNTSSTKGFVRSLPTLKGMKPRTKWRWWFDTDSAEDLSCFAVLSANYAALKSNTMDGDE